MFSYIKDLILPKFCDFISIVAGAGSDNTAYDGAEYDISEYHSAIVTVGGEAVLQDGETLTLTVQVLEADPGGSFTVAETLANAEVVATGGTGGSTEEGLVSYKYDAKQYKKRQKIRVTPDLSAGATDTAKLVSEVLLLDAKEQPQTLPTEF